MRQCGLADELTGAVAMVSALICSEHSRGSWVPPSNIQVVGLGHSSPNALNLMDDVCEEITLEIQ